ncbi:MULTISPECIES: hypothetical protein [Anaerococcus]|uniref:Uncharacterized protein n=2 Tax=Anaerococcus TaxID=165779 RepID=A0A3E2TI84_9FIRM|nr:MULTISPECIES: hypothetical protein [Anaerococcus]MBP2069562.1 hypothetical protein [Anaerococcus nagyae]MDU1829140.1 hypothetical protein [Anaerococcus sp.]MDU1864127.1 hypothetical protein [Anaerococcus sp.]MDU2565414.1 hypothetical protein [Anaerococcus sp.]MDU3211133.1 hypothetical protein [Anaerococcus sp.]
MKKRYKFNITRYIIYLIILVIAYHFVISHPFTNKEKTRDEIVSENIKDLEKSTNELKGLIKKDKDALNSFFYNEKTYEKIRGLIDTYPDDRELKINDNLKIILNQEGSPVKVRYKRAEFEIVNTKLAPTEDSQNKPEVITDVKVIENPNGINRFELIHDLKTYLVDSYGQNALNNFLDGIIRDTIIENKEIIDKLGKNNKEN